MKRIRNDAEGYLRGSKGYANEETRFRKPSSTVWEPTPLNDGDVATESTATMAAVMATAPYFVTRSPMTRGKIKAKPVGRLAARTSSIGLRGRAATVATA
jgi:hypothetical protein